MGRSKVEEIGGKPNENITSEKIGDFLNQVRDFMNGANSAVSGQIPSDEEFMRWLGEVMTPMLMSMGVAQADMEIFTKIWNSRYGETSPSLQSPESREAFLSVLEEGLKIIASGSQHITDIDPALKQQIDSYIARVES